MGTEAQAGFEDRRHAGAALGMKLALELPAGNYLVLGLLRGGIPVAFEAAQALGAELGAMAVRKLGVPSNPELAFGAIAQYGKDSHRHANEEIYRRALQYFGKDELDALEHGTRADLHALASEFKDYFPDPAGRTVILCDDGMATGATMKACLQLLESLSPASVILAAPVAAAEVAAELAALADKVIIVLQPQNFGAVGAHYKDFGQVPASQALDLLHSAT